MKRVSAVMFTALAFCLLVATPVLASSEVPPPSGPQVEGEVVRAGGTAFTGANISLGVLLMVSFLLAGIALFAISRRKATAGR
jgi:hypothetical protein